MALSIDGKTRHFHRDLTWKVCATILFISVGATAAEAYLFKYLQATYEFSAISYYVASTIPGVLFLLAAVVWKGRLRKLTLPAAVAYIPYAALGKNFDAFNFCPLHYRARNGHALASRRLQCPLASRSRLCCRDRATFFRPQPQGKPRCLAR